MKANELMVGDFIYQHHPKDNTPHIVKVSVDTLNLMDRMEIGFIQEQSPLYRIIEPIPLTPEILEKNGFYHETNVGYIDDDYNGRQIIYDFWNHNLKIIYNYKTMLDIEGWLDHIHVHELQHALKLCGIEKIIEL